MSSEPRRGPRRKAEPENEPENEPTPPAGPETGPEADDGLVEVRKGGEALRVHPTTLAAHAAAGWRPEAERADSPS